MIAKNPTNATDGKIIFKNLVSVIDHYFDM